MKTHYGDSLEWYIARLVAKGLPMNMGIDYKENFAVVAKMTTVPTLIFLFAV